MHTDHFPFQENSFSTDLNDVPTTVIDFHGERQLTFPLFTQEREAAPRRDRRLRTPTKHVPVRLCSWSVRCLQCSSLLPSRHQAVKVMLRAAGRCRQCSVARRRCAERSELLYLLRCIVVGAGGGGGILCRLVMRKKMRAISGESI